MRGRRSFSFPLPFYAFLSVLLTLDMLGVLSAEGAIFAALQTIRSVLLVLDRVVVPLLAFIASECDFYSCACSHSFGTSYFIYPRRRGAGIASLCGRGLRTFSIKKRTKRKPLVRQVIHTIAQPKREVKYYFRIFCVFFCHCAFPAPPRPPEARIPVIFHKNGAFAPPEFLHTQTRFFLYVYKCLQYNFTIHRYRR